MAMNLKTGLTRVALELKVLRTNFTKQNILISRFEHHLGLSMSSKKPVPHHLALVLVKTLPM